MGLIDYDDAPAYYSTTALTVPGFAGGNFGLDPFIGSGADIVRSIPSGSATDPAHESDTRGLLDVFGEQILGIAGGFASEFSRGLAARITGGDAGERNRFDTTAPNGAVQPQQTIAGIPSNTLAIGALAVAGVLGAVLIAKAL